MESLTKDELIKSYQDAYAVIPQDALELDLRVTIKTIQILAEGNPISPEQLSEVWEMPLEQVRGILEGASASGRAQVNTNGDLVGGVLSLLPTPHHISFDQTELYAWCAYDAIYAPGIVGMTATITSRDPATDEQIEVTITPSGVLNAQPAGTMVSVVGAQMDMHSGPTSPRCTLQRFFGSRDSAEEWLQDRTGVVILSVNEVFEIARQFQIEPARRLGLL